MNILKSAWSDWPNNLTDIFDGRFHASAGGGCTINTSTLCRKTGDSVISEYGTDTPQQRRERPDID